VKLATKILVPVMLLLAIVVGAAALVAVREESERYEIDLHQDHAMLAAAVVAAARVEGERVMSSALSVLCSGTSRMFDGDQLPGRPAQVLEREGLREDRGRAEA
jgi:hypothetical protein